MSSMASSGGDIVSDSCDFRSPCSDVGLRRPEQIRPKIVLSYQVYAELGLAVLAAVDDPSRCDMVTAAHLRRLRAAWERVEEEIG